LLRSQFDATGETFHSKLAYTQLSRKFAGVRPHARFQWVTSPSGDPLNAFIGKYEGPSAGDQRPSNSSPGSASL
jgi:hypothetical protein